MTARSSRSGLVEFAEHTLRQAGAKVQRGQEQLVLIAVWRPGLVVVVARLSRHTLLLLIVITDGLVLVFRVWLDRRGACGGGWFDSSLALQVPDGRAHPALAIVAAAAVGTGSCMVVGGGMRRSENKENTLF